MDYVLDPENNSKPNAKDFEILYELYGYIPNGTSTSNSSSRRHKQRQMDVVELSSRPAFISFTERNNHQQHQHHPWRLLKRTKNNELHVLDLGNGHHMIARVMLA